MTLDPFAFIALIFGAATVGSTATTFTSVLVGVPGRHRVAGDNSRRLSDGQDAAKPTARWAPPSSARWSAPSSARAAFMISLPFFKPLVLSLGSPEFLMMVLLGLSAVAILGGTQPVKGLISAVVGLSIALVGTDARTGIERFTFGSSYLWDGVSLIITRWASSPCRRWSICSAAKPASRRWSR